MLFAILFTLAAGIITGGSVYLAKRKKESISLPGKPAWPKDQLPLLVLIDENATRVVRIAENACHAWNQATARQFFAFGGYERDVEAFLRPSPGVVVVRFMSDLATRPHAQLTIVDGKIRASPILAPSDLEDDKILQIVTHELGHALGLGHSTDAASVMYEKATPWAKNITAADVRALGELYPA